MLRIVKGSLRWCLTTVEDFLLLLGLGRLFYVAGLAVLTAGIAQVHAASAWIVCGAVLLGTSVYSYWK